MVAAEAIELVATFEVSAIAILSSSSVAVVVVDIDDSSVALALVLFPSTLKFSTTLWQSSTTGDGDDDAVSGAADGGDNGSAACITFVGEEQIVASLFTADASAMVPAFVSTMINE